MRRKQLIEKLNEVYSAFEALKAEVTLLRAQAAQPKKEGAEENAPVTTRKQIQDQAELYQKIEDLAKLADTFVKQAENVRYANPQVVTSALGSRFQGEFVQMAQELSSGISSLRSTLLDQVDLSQVSGTNKSDRVREVSSLPKHEQYSKLEATLRAGLMPMLVGPAGTGKSTAVEQAAYALGLDFYTANRVQLAHELTGYKNAMGEYQPTQFYHAYKNGGVFFLDEIDGSSPEALVTINTALAQGYMNFPNGRVYMHRDFRLAAAGNTYGTGADAQYVGRNELDAATLDRFVMIHWDYDRKLEQDIIKDGDLLDFAWDLRRVVAKLNLPIIISTRGLINTYKITQSQAFSKADALESVLLEGLTAQDVLTLRRELKCHNSWASALNTLYKNLESEELSKS